MPISPNDDELEFGGEEDPEGSQQSSSDPTSLPLFCPSSFEFPTETFKLLEAKFDSLINIGKIELREI